MAETLQGLSASDLMTVWERGSALDDVGRAVLLLAYSEAMSPQQAARLDIGRRDQRLLVLRSATFGARLETFLQCEQCGEPLEFSMDAQQFSTAPTGLGVEVAIAQVDGLSMRLPDSMDLQAAAKCRSVEEARRTLFSRCVAVTSDDPATNEPSEAMLQRFSGWLAETSPELDILLDVDCPACGVHRVVAFDIVSFFWREIESACARLVREVDALARTYGWSEAQILGMAPARRQLYLEAVTV